MREPGRYLRGFLARHLLRQEADGTKLYDEARARFEATQRALILAR